MTDVVKKESTCQKIGEATTDEGDDAEVKLSHSNLMVTMTILCAMIRI